MERGAISRVRLDRGYGRLVRLQFGGAEIGFSAEDLVGCSFDQLRVGYLVDFELSARAVRARGRGVKAARVIRRSGRRRRGFASEVLPGTRRVAMSVQPSRSTLR
jgi:hypothetical protein